MGVVVFLAELTFGASAFLVGTIFLAPATFLEAIFFSGAALEGCFFVAVGLAASFFLAAVGLAGSFLAAAFFSSVFFTPIGFVLGGGTALPAGVFLAPFLAGAPTVFARVGPSFLGALAATVFGTVSLAETTGILLYTRCYWKPGLGVASHKRN